MLEKNGSAVLFSCVCLNKTTEKNSKETMAFDKYSLVAVGIERLVYSGEKNSSDLEF